MPAIIFTGGGSAGHVTPNLALISIFQSLGWRIDYIGEKNGVEQSIINSISIPFHPISCGKLRRYFSWQNFLDPFKIVLGIAQTYSLLHRLKADVVFSKGGFVAFPVVFAAWLKRIPIVAHESDLTPGLANRLSFPFVNKICLTFVGAERHFTDTSRTEVTGTPLREQLFQGLRSQGLSLCGFSGKKPCLLIIGGGQGSTQINEAVRANLEKLTVEYHIIHLCGPGKLQQALTSTEDYFQQEYASDTLAHFFAAADMVISRAGANTLYELLALQKPHILIPLSAKVSRGDQLENARYFEQQQISLVIDNDSLTPELLLLTINKLALGKDAIISRIQQLSIQPANQRITAIIKEYSHVRSAKNTTIL